MPLPAFPSSAAPARRTPADVPRPVTSRGGLWGLAVGAVLAIGWDLGGWDHALAAAMGGSGQGFALREQWFLTQVLHNGGRIASWALAIALAVGVWWPWGVLRRLDRAARVQWIVGTLAAVALVALLKSRNPAACPWDLVVFGGTAPDVSHWRWLHPTATGHCFPAGHASSSFGFLGAWFVFRPVAPRLARQWLVGVLLVGLVLGLGQQWRGAHFMSHTLWTAWLCWAVALVADRVRERVAPRSASGFGPLEAA